MNFKQFLEDTDERAIAKMRDEFDLHDKLNRGALDRLTDLWEKWIFAKDDQDHAPTMQLKNKALETVRELERIIMLYDPGESKIAKDIAEKRVRDLKED